MLKWIRGDFFGEEMIKFSLPRYRSWPAWFLQGMEFQAEWRTWATKAQRSGLFQELWLSSRGYGTLGGRRRANAEGLPESFQPQIYIHLKGIHTSCSIQCNRYHQQVKTAHFLLGILWPQNTSQHITAKNLSYYFWVANEKIGDGQCYYVKSFKNINEMCKMVTFTFGKDSRGAAKRMNWRRGDDT